MMAMSRLAPARHTRLVVALALAIAALTLPSPSVPAARAASPVGVGDIMAGTANRTSLHLVATYDARL